jgi:hypothetical protein
VAQSQGPPSYPFSYACRSKVSSCSYFLLFNVQVEALAPHAEALVEAFESLEDDTEIDCLPVQLLKGLARLPPDAVRPFKERVRLACGKEVCANTQIPNDFSICLAMILMLFSSGHDAVTRRVVGEPEQKGGCGRDAVAARQARAAVSGSGPVARRGPSLDDDQRLTIMSVLQGSN